MSKQKYICDSIAAVKKAENQDNFLVLEEYNYMIFLVLDGVGSAANSKKATILACDFIKENCKNILASELSLSKLMLETNKYILNHNIPETLTTYCIAYVPNTPNTPIIYSSMGDTRLYFKSKQYFEQITIDDRAEGTKNVITKCLGMNFTSISDFKQYQIKKNGNNILICTDGFYSFLEENRLHFFEILNKVSLKSIKENLKSIINKNNTDDSTYVFIK